MTSAVFAEFPLRIDTKGTPRAEGHLLSTCLLDTRAVDTVCTTDTWPADGGMENMPGCCVSVLRVWVCTTGDQYGPSGTSHDHRFNGRLEQGKVYCILACRMAAVSSHGGELVGSLVVR